MVASQLLRKNNYIHDEYVHTLSRVGVTYKTGF
jgi:hypothetical protein